MLDVLSPERLNSKMKKLDKKNVEDIFVLTPMQEGMLFHYLKAPGTDFYFEQLSLEISGEIDWNIFEKAWDFVIETNELLRTVFNWERVEKPIQIVLKHHKLQSEFCDFTDVELNEKNRKLEELKDRDRKAKFNLKEVPFWITVCQIEKDKYEMIISNHHILFDGWSTGIILSEFFNAYNDLSSGKRLVKPVKTKFKEFVKWMQGRDLDGQEKFWRNYLKGFNTQTELSVKRKKRRERPITGTEVYQMIPGRETKTELEDFVKKHKITLASLMYSAWGLLLQKYNNTNDVIFGTTVSGRAVNLPGIEDIVGLFINTIPLRAQTFSNEKIEDFLHRIHNAVQIREEFETTSLVSIRESSEINHQEELFDSIIVIENYPLDSRLILENSKLSVGSFKMVEMTHYDLTISISTGQHIDVTFGYNKELLDDQTIMRLSQHFKGILKSIMANPGKEISAIEIISEEERHKILYEFNDTDTDFPKDKTITQLFVEQVERTPDHVAIVGRKPKFEIRNRSSYKQIQMTKIQNSNPEGTRALAPLPGFISITYKKLNEKADQLAVLLIEKGVKPDTIVGIMVEKSIEMIIGILGILKARGAYLPIEPNHPADRVTHMLDDSGTQILLKAETKSDDQSTNCSDRENVPIVLNLENLNFEFVGYSCDWDFRASNLRPANLAYVIYTSGSTGYPKGVLVEQRNLVAYISAFCQEFNILTHDTVLQQASYVFDTFVEEVFPVLIKGGRLAIPSKEEILDIDLLSNFIDGQRVSLISCPPLLLEQLNRKKDWDTIHTFISGGDVLKREYIANLVKTGRVYNTYGPTEATVCVTYHKCRITDGIDSGIPIGKPISNYRVYILDKDNKLLPVGIPGELCASGAGITRGYLNQPELTAEKFKRAVKGHWSSIIRSSNKLSKVANDQSLMANGKSDKAHNDHCPMSNDRSHLLLHHSPHSPIYRTGDLGRWFGEDGNIEFLGRVDHQVNIRGVRIELGEVESHLMQYPGIEEVVVTAKTDDTKAHFLCAYVIPSPGGVLEISQLRGYLQQKLPVYMVPAYFVTLDKMSMTASGKIDRKLLPAPQATSTKTYAAPRNELEAELVKIWSEVLGIESSTIGINDNFFELGGHSLKIAGLVGRIHKRLNIKLLFTIIFEAPTIKELAELIGKSKECAYTEIPSSEKKEYYKLSSAQKRLFFLYRMAPQRIAYNMPGLMTLEGDIETGKMEQVFQQLINRHESLRTTFHTKNEEPFQYIHEARRDKFQITTYPQSPTSNFQIQKIIEDFVRPFDLSRAPLLRVGLIELSHTPAALPGHLPQERKEQKYILMVDMHHIISDGVSIDLLTEEFVALYKGETLPALKIQHKDFSEWQGGPSGRGAIKQQEKFWLRELGEEIPNLNLPTDYPRPTVQGFEGSEYHFEIPSSHTRALNELALTRGATLFMVLLSLYTILLSKLSNQVEIIVGTPVSGRSHTDLEPIIGMFVNTLVLRNFPHGGYPFKEFLEVIKTRTSNAFNHQNLPYAELVEKVVKKRDASRNPLFDVMFSLENRSMFTPSGGVTKTGIEDFKIEPYPYENRAAKFDLSLTAAEEEETLNLKFEYSTRLFKKDTIGRFIDYFKNIISAVLEDPGKKISAIDIISQEEKNQILHEFNDTWADYSRDKTLDQLFEEQVERTADRIALLGNNTHLSYRVLSEKTDQLANLLRGKGVLVDSIVGVMVGHSPETIIGIFGILKAGGAYLPLDPAYPGELIQYMLADSNARILLSRDAEAHLVSPLELDIVSIPEILRKEAGPLPAAETALIRQPVKDLIYIIYTSGSTGKPKGVMVTHQNLNNLLYGLKQRVYRQYQYERGLNLSQVAPFIFDASAQQIYLALLEGNCLHIVPGDTRTDGAALVDFYCRHAIDVSDGTPTHIRLMLESSSDVEGLYFPVWHFIIGGEELLQHIVNRFFERLVNPPPRLTNVYGPTETCVNSTSYQLTQENINKRDDIPIGKPLPNERIYILDNHNHLCPVGVPGELFIGGEGISRGYLNQPELTFKKYNHKEGKNAAIKKYNKKFLPGGSGGAVFSKSAPPGCRRQRIYKTGDLARWLPDGNIKFLGRIDHQVKIRGFRIEVGGIESQLLKHKDINDVFVVLKEDKAGDKSLVSYFVSCREVPALELKEYLSRELPGYMIPSCFVRLDKIPLTSTGKINQSALPEPLFKPQQEYAPPRDEIEKKLVDIWSAVLEKEKDMVGIDANFFELGGHSLKATILVSKIHKEFDVKVPLAEIFKNLTIKELSRYIKEAVKDEFSVIEPSEKKEYYPLSSAQKRLYILQQLVPFNTNYNLSLLFEMEGDFDKQRTEETFRKLIERHESLRTGFQIVRGKLVQKIHNRVAFEIQYSEAGRKENGYEMWGVKETEVLDKKQIMKNFVKAFDLSQAPLLRVKVIKTAKAKYIMVVDMHHIIMDGVSEEIFYGDFMSLYSRRELPGLRIQYKDFSQWQKGLMKSGKMKAQEEYWLNQFENEVPVLKLPTDYPRPAVQSFDGKRILFELDEEETGALNKVAKEEDATLFMVILAQFNILISKLSGQEEITVGTVTAGRSHVHLESVIGMFVNMLALKNFPEKKKKFKEFLKEVKGRTIKAFENQDYQFEALVEKLGASNEMGRHPLFDVGVGLQNVEAQELNIQGLTLNPYEYEDNMSKFDLSFYGKEKDGRIVFSVEYCKRLFKKETVELFIKYFREIIMAITLDRDVKLEDIRISHPYFDQKIENPQIQFGF